MNSVSAIALVAILAASLATSAEAQSLNMSSVVAGIGDRAFLDGVEHISTANSINLVLLSTLSGAENSHDLVQQTRQLKSSDIEFLQSAVVINFQAMVRLRDAGFSLSQVISAVVSHDGAATLLIDDL
jgi:hypothetical protein